MHAVIELPSVLFGKEFLLHKNQIVFSGPMRIYNLFTSGLNCKNVFLGTTEQKKGFKESNKFVLLSWSHSFLNMRITSLQAWFTINDLNVYSFF